MPPCELSDGGTGIAFEYAWQTAPWSERLAVPLVRAMLSRANRRALRRLAEQLPPARRRPRLRLLSCR